MLTETQQLLRASSLLLIRRDYEIKNLQFLLSNAQAHLGALQSETVPEEEPELTWAKQPLYLSDEEEDIKWQFDHEFIDLKTYETLMKELDFQNSEVQFADEYAPENFHY